MEKIMMPTEYLQSGMTAEERLADKCAAYNAIPGDGICTDCLGRGYIHVVKDGYIVTQDCHCAALRRSLARIKRSGLGEMYQRYSMDTFKTDRPWQETIKKKAQEYIAAPSGWFFVCGRSGSGKTHITCAVARELMEGGAETRYFMWRQDAPRLKALVNDRAEYEARMKELVNVRLLLIDDLFKGNVTEADINLAFELLNSRYNSPSKLTVISSERTAEDILKIDEAVGGRIIERARGYLLQTGKENMRLCQ